MCIKKLLICAGAMKAGTSYLFKMLERHPGIEVTPIKEIHYFAHVHTPLAFLDDPARMYAMKTYASHLEPGGSVEDARRDLRFFSRFLRAPIDDAWYEGLFESGADVYKADFSNMASILPEEGLRHMCRIAEDLRMLYVLRDPLARLWSHVKFHAAVNHEIWRLNAFDSDQFVEYIEASGAAAQSQYGDNIERMRRYIPDARLKIIYFEDLVAKPRETLGSVFHFLGLAPITFEDGELDVVHNPGPDAIMPAAFTEAADKYLAALPEQMGRVGIPAHRLWRNIEAVSGRACPMAGTWETPVTTHW